MYVFNSFNFIIFILFVCSLSSVVHQESNVCETRDIEIISFIFFNHCFGARNHHLWFYWNLFNKIETLLHLSWQEELEVLRAKVERLEQERNHLKHDNDRLEAKVWRTKFFYFVSRRLWHASYTWLIESNKLTIINNKHAKPTSLNVQCLRFTQRNLFLMKRC